MSDINLVKYEPNALADFGNNYMFALVASAAALEDAQKLQEAANNATAFLSFEMTKAVFDLDERFEDVDVHAVFGKPKDIEKLNQRVLVHFGVLKREITKDDEIVYNWTSENIAALYDYSAELKDKNEAEYIRRHNNRKRLNMRLSDAYKAAAALKDNGLKADDLFYSEHPETKEMVPTIRNAPKEIAGDKSEVQLGARKPVAGANMSPTMASLIKIATSKHKEGGDAEKKDKGENREGTAKLGMSDEDFGAIVNNLRRSITAQEGTFSEEMIKHLAALRTMLDEVLPKKGK